MPFEYTTDDVPAPYLHVTISSQLGEILKADTRVIDVPMMIDTGADICCIPSSVIEKIEATLGVTLEYDFCDAVCFDGSVTRKKIYTLDLDCAFGENMNMQFVEINGGVGVIGRLVLNLFTTHFIGKKREWNFEV